MRTLALPSWFVQMLHARARTDPVLAPRMGGWRDPVARVFVSERDKPPGQQTEPSAPGHGESLRPFSATIMTGPTDIEDIRALPMILISTALHDFPLYIGLVCASTGGQDG